MILADSARLLPLHISMVGVVLVSLLGCDTDTSSGRDQPPGGGDDAPSGGDALVPDPGESTFCAPCTTNANCGGEDDYCVTLPGGGFCGRSCRVPGDCFAGFDCVVVTAGSVAQCVPHNDVCCLDADGDLRGTGGGCAGPDCDDSNAAIYNDAAEICDGLDNDCDGATDIPPTDCAAAGCGLGLTGFEATVAANCGGGDGCTTPVPTSCGLYTCDGGGEDGDACAFVCNGEDDILCAPTAHCEASVCVLDLSDGAACNEPSDCDSGHCQNGFCCATGDCCQSAPDCPNFGTIAAICDAPTSCQGSRGEVLCSNDAICSTTGAVDDDSACDDAVEASDCGAFPSLFCTGAVAQSAPSCANTCSSHGECDATAFCDEDTSTCLPDLANGVLCADDESCQSGHCQNGFCCEAGDCCATEANCPTAYWSAPICQDSLVCQGTAVVAACNASECASLSGVEDDSGCDSTTQSSACGPYPAVFCTGGAVQSQPTCASSCSSDAECDADAFCGGAGTCLPDQGDGQPCSDADQCQSGHCQNDHCCVAGDCCADNEDCLAYDSAPVCTAAATCQGTRVDGLCSAEFRCVGQTTDDDSACGPTVMANDCGPYLDLFCSGGAEQTSPVCSGSCSQDTDCDDAGHCDAPTCLPDVNLGGTCNEDSDCMAGFPCVDDVCCNMLCPGTCVACDLASTLGTCSPVPNGQDPDEECGALSCSAYYWGWSGDTCYRRADISAAAATCAGDGSCKTAASACIASGQGSPAVTCDSFCQDPTGGTCTGTVAGTCTNVSQGNETCGFGACQVTVPRCVGGVPNPCTPNIGTDESCNDIDDNCDGFVDNGNFSDVLEPNGSCAAVRTLATVRSNETRTYYDLTVYGSGDEDYFLINASENDSTCSCCDFFCTDEDFRLTVSLTVPAGAGSYVFCVGTSCGGLGANCVEILAGQTNSWTYTFDGNCPAQDNYQLYVRISGDNAPAYECRPYTLSYTFTPGCF